MKVCFVCKKGDTFLLESGPEYDRQRMHLFIVCTNPNTDGECLVVSVTSKPSRQADMDYVLDNMVHSFLQHTSYIPFGKAKLMRTADIDKKLDAQKAIRREPMNPTILGKIIATMSISKYLPRDCRKHLLEHKDA